MAEKNGEVTTKTPSLARLDMGERIADKPAYEKRLGKLQQQMLQIQQAYYHGGHRGIIVFEGWDASGKGGTIRRMTERLDPRGYKVWPIAAPKPEEQGRHYLYRFWQRLPEPGHIALFDRSWYGRVLVERVEGLCTETEWRRAYDEINSFEHMLADDGVRIVKLFLHIDKDEQLKRFGERLAKPHKRWKLTTEDIRNHERWDDYVAAIDEMFARTATAWAPWHPLAANQKWNIRVRALETVTEALAQGIDVAPPPLDPAVQKAAAERLGLTA